MNTKILKVMMKDLQAEKTLNNNDDRCSTINSLVFDTDFDNVGYDPVVVKGDDDEESKFMFGY